MARLFAEWVEKEKNQANFGYHMDWRSTANIIYMLPMRGTRGFRNYPFE
jgi:hypothetical protein